MILSPLKVRIVAAPNEYFGVIMSEPDRSVESTEPSGHKRRVRYSGSHPISFEHKYKEHKIDQHPELLDHLRQKGKTPAGMHIPIMLTEVMEHLVPKPGDIVADCTVGYGGHAAEFLKRIGAGGRLIAFDVDGGELERTKQRLSGYEAAKSFYRSNFAGIANVMGKEGIDGYDVIFADIGVSSMQIDNPARGLSYKYPGPLDMRMDDRLKQTGADMLATLSAEQIAKALRDFADEPDSDLIADRIAGQREEQPITQTQQLVEVIFEAKGIDRKEWKNQQRNSKTPMLNPAARTFQALRILVNDELGVLKELLRVAPYCLRTGGRIGIISFHSGEDRIVKHSFRDGLDDGTYTRIAEHAITPTPEELAANPRSASAKFRWAMKG